MGKKSTKQTATAQPWQPAQGSILGAINTTQNTVDQNQGNLNSIAGGIQGYLPQLGQMAFGSNPTLGAANNYATDVLGGKYLNSNPYLDQMINQTNQGVTDQVNSIFGKAGVSMGTPHAAALGTALANADNSLRFNAYNTERQNQQQAASMAPSLYSGQFAGVSPYLSAAQTAGQLPYAGLNSLSPIIGLAGGSGTQSKTTPGGWGTDLLSAAVAAAPYIFA